MSEIAADAANESKTEAPQGPALGAVSRDIIAAGPGQSAADGTKAARQAAGAKARAGSALILIPPVTRQADGHQSIPNFAAKEAAAAADFAAERVSPHASFKEARACKEDPGLKRGWLRYAGPAALGFCLFGIGVAMGGQFFGVSAPAHPSAQAAMGAAQLAQTNAEEIEIHRLAKKLGDEIHTLQARVDALRLAAQSQNPEDLRGLKKGLDELKASFESAKAETSASIAQVTAKIDRLQHGEARLEKPLEKTIRAEAALTPPAMAKGAAKPVPPTPETRKKLQLLSDWVVRDVYRGVALVEGPEGAIEVTPGESIPGAGTVQSIEYGRTGWIVITSRGVVASARE